MAHKTLPRTFRRMSTNPAIRLLFAGLLVIFTLQWAITHNHDWYLGPEPALGPTAKLDSMLIDWGQYKYVQIVATPEDLCSAVMIWTQIEEYGSRASRLMLYPSSWDQEKVIQTHLTNGVTATTRLLRQAARESYVKLQPVDVLNTNSIWTNPSYTKLLAFNLTDFSRILVLDPASEVRQNMDEPFLLPKSPIAMPYIYSDGSRSWEFSPHLMLVSSSTSKFEEVEKAVKAAGSRSKDLEILKQVFPYKIQRLNHKQYGFITSELRQDSHAEYLGSISAIWDLDIVLPEVKLLHYSDLPSPKPWFKSPQYFLNKHMPKCVKSEWFGASNCRDREVWFKLYADYSRKRKAVCGADFEVKKIPGEKDNLGVRNSFLADEM